MRAVRTVASALALFVGALLVLTWSVASIIIAVIDDGPAVRDVAGRALSSPQLMDSLSNEIASHAVTALRQQGIDPAAVGLDEAKVSQVIARELASPAFQSALVAEIDKAHTQVSAQLAEPSRGSAPLSVKVDLSDAVNARVKEAGGPLALLPPLDLPVTNLELLDAGQFEQARDVYSGVRAVERWGLWCALAVLAGGAWVSPRRRWFAMKFFLLFGALSIGLGFEIGSLDRWLSDDIPGFTQGVGATLWTALVTEDVAAHVRGIAFWAGGVSLALALVAAIVAQRRRRPRTSLRSP